MIEEHQDKTVTILMQKPIQPPNKPPSQEQILRMLEDFDLSSKYGPCIGITRKLRYQRAIKYGLNPPKQIEAYLESHPQSYYDQIPFI